MKRFVPYYTRQLVITVMLMSVLACASGGGGDKFRNPNMDFGSVQTVAVLPFTNLSRDQMAADRVRDVFVTALLASGDIYVIPVGEVAKGIGLAGIVNPSAPSSAEVMKLAPLIKANALITGVLREYGEVRSGSSTANAISLSLQMMDAQTGQVIWSTSTTKGGIGIKDRLLGGGGDPMNNITEQAIKDLINQLYE
ncbi:MAG TPA: GNA1162 family protein [Thermodesulfovibrionales bacterium]|nr:GNA1162 family protein [Thermodesulfovibrionales bacterium]